MNKTKDYLYAVSAIRSSENNLLTKADLERLINSPDYESAVAFLTEKGYEEPKGSDYSSMLDKELENCWDTVKNSAPEAEAINAFIVKNDFQNLKAIIKSEVMEHNAKDYLVKPSVIDPDKLFEKVSAREFGELPDFIKNAGEKALDTLTQTGNGQLSDIVIDSAALEAIIYFATLSGDGLLIKYANTFCLAADIKTALRAIKTEKNEVFLNEAIADNSFINKSSFISAALSGEEDFMNYLSSSGFGEYKDALENGTSAFEKYCDDAMLEIIKGAKMTVFGISPLAAYYLAKETEIKCLRIILSAKLSSVSNDTVRERMRELYV